MLDHDDDVVGTVHVKHAVAVPRSERAHHAGQAPDGRRRSSCPTRCASTRCCTLLRAEGFQLAVVLDEYGGHGRHRDPRGRDRGDRRRHRRRARPARRPARQRRDGSWIVSGLLRPDEVEDLTGLGLPEHEDYDTVAGLVLRVLGRVPERGDVAEVPVPGRDPDDDDADPVQQLAVLTVEHMDGLRIDRLSLRRGRQAGAPGRDRG